MRDDAELVVAGACVVVVTCAVGVDVAVEVSSGQPERFSTWAAASEARGDGIKVADGSAGAADVPANGGGPLQPAFRATLSRAVLLVVSSAEHFTSTGGAPGHADGAVTAGWSTTPDGSSSPPPERAATMPAAGTINAATHAARSALRRWPEPTAAAAVAPSI
jgi:hypothetical protein